jgi:hypothetical protein
MQNPLFGSIELERSLLKAVFSRGLCGERAVAFGTFPPNGSGSWAVMGFEKNRRFW